MIDLLSKLPGLHDAPGEVEVKSDEEIAAEARAERIKFHRNQVRNGPVNFKSLTTGQIRRAQARATQSAIRKNRRRAVSDHLAAKREAATLRGWLQAIGVLPYATEGYKASEGIVKSSLIHIVQTYGEPDESSQISVSKEVVDTAIQKAVERYHALTGSGS
jgi:hypothetical protein